MATVKNRTRFKRPLDTVATCLVIAVCIQALISLRADRRATGEATTRPVKPVAARLPSEPIDLDGATTLGDGQAKVALIIYSDFQCPFCAKFGLTTLPEIKRKYVDTGLIRLVFRNLPLESIHPYAMTAAQAANCAATDGRFLQMHDLLFQNQRSLAHPKFTDWAQAAGVDGRRFESCLGTMSVEGIRKEARAANALGIVSTPTFMWGEINTNGRVQAAGRLAGAVTFKRFEAVLDPIVATGKPISTKAGIEDGARKF